MNYEVLKETAICLKENKEGDGKEMGKVSQELVEYGMKKGMERGRAEGYGNVALEMIRRAMPVHLIQDLTKLSLEQLQELSKQSGVALVY